MSASQSANGNGSVHDPCCAHDRALCSIGQPPHRCDMVAEESRILMSLRDAPDLNLRQRARGNVSHFAQPALAQFSNRISKDSSHVLRKRQYFGHLHKEIERSVVINDASDRRRQFRSEEHTSELQSLMRISYAVFCLK